MQKLNSLKNGELSAVSHELRAKYVSGNRIENSANWRFFSRGYSSQILVACSV